MLIASPSASATFALLDTFETNVSPSVLIAVLLEDAVCELTLLLRQSLEVLPELHFRRFPPDELLVISEGDRWQWYGLLPAWQPDEFRPPECDITDAGQRNIMAIIAKRNNRNPSHF